jgi:superfamily II DNA helicase RecQ
MRLQWDFGFLLLLFFRKEKKIFSRAGIIMLRIFTVEYDPIKKSFDDSALSTFLAGKSVISIEKRFFKQNSRFFWTFAIEYETDKAGGSKDIELESDAQKGLFLALKEWRNELAAEKGVPPYLLFTNNQLRQIAIAQPKTPEELKNIQIISNKKAQDYAEPVLKIISEQECDEQEPAIPDLCPMA